MRTSIVIDDDLMRSALELSGLKTKRAAIEEGLRLLVLFSRQSQARQFRGKLHWADDLNMMRADR